VPEEEAVEQASGLGSGYPVGQLGARVLEVLKRPGVAEVDPKCASIGEYRGPQALRLEGRIAEVRVERGRAGAIRDQLREQTLGASERIETQLAILRIEAARIGVDRLLRRAIAVLSGRCRGREQPECYEQCERPHEPASSRRSASCSPRLCNVSPLEIEVPEGA
jgi:hypothetical protein